MQQVAGVILSGRRAKRARAQDGARTRRRYVGAEAQEDNGEPFEEKMMRLTATCGVPHPRRPARHAPASCCRVK